MAEGARQILPDRDTLSRQAVAASPDRSVWVSANAGSGKTYVLATRVIRLLLAGTDPSRILCLTYTKTAAAEMKDRVFKRLGAWVTMPEGDLRKALRELESGEPDAAKLAFARCLFARALETPGGLKIQTIHAFCDALLRRFPLEAGISPRFEVLDDRQKALMTDAILAELAAEAESVGLEVVASRLKALSARLSIDSERDYCRHQRTEILGLMRSSIQQLKSWREKNVHTEWALR